MGAEEQLFVIHKDIVCASSNFFKAACSDSWIEGKERRVRMPEVEPELFQTYITWLYSGNAQAHVSKDDPDGAIELYLLADVLDDVHLRNKMTEVLSYSDCIASPTALCKLWDRTPLNSLIKKMYVEQFLMRTDRDEFAKFVTEYPAGLVQEVAAASLRLHSCAMMKRNEWSTTKLASYLEPVSEDG